MASFRVPGAVSFHRMQGSQLGRWLGEQSREACFRAVSGTSVVAI